MSLRSRLAQAVVQAANPGITAAPLARPRAKGEYMKGFAAPVMFGWQPVLREPNDEVREVWHEATAKAIDALHNSGWLAGGIEQATSGIVGSGLALNARPDPALFGGNTADAGVWSRQMERRFEAWARSAYACDVYNRHPLGVQCRNAVKSWFGTGEIVGVVRFKRQPGQRYGTKMMLLPSQRLARVSTNERAREGVVMDADGAPVRYVFSNPHPTEEWRREEVEVAARDELGRPQVIHIHESPASVIRGITPLAPALRVIRQFDQLANATLTASLIQAIFAATIESPSPTEALLEALQNEDEQDSYVGEASTGVEYATPGGGVTAPTGLFDKFMASRFQWYRSTKFDLGQFGKVVHTYPGEKLEFKEGKTPGANYKDFSRSLLREVARCLGITYEQLTGDREGSTYSSDKMGGSEIDLITSHRRTNLAGRFMQTAWEAWLEEEIELGDLAGTATFPGGLPAFLASRDGASRADWRGPPKPSADELKDAKADEVKLKNRVITREQWAAKLGSDWEDNFEQLAREQEVAEELELTIDMDQAALDQAAEASEVAAADADAREVA